MKAYEVVLNGTNLKDFGAYMTASTILKGPEKKTKSWDVPARSGALTKDYKAFRNFTFSCTLYILKDVVPNMIALNSFLKTLRGYVKYKDSTMGNQYRMVRFISPFDPETYDHAGGVVKLTFDSMPQLFIDDGDTVISLTEGTHRIYNYTPNETLPLFRVFGSGTLTVNDLTMTVTSGGTEYIDIDSQLCMCYEGNESRGDRVQSELWKYPVLQPGINEIIIEGFTKVELTPRWYL